MQNKKSINPDYNFPENVKEENNKITCKDGYCFIPNSEENKAITNESINIFDPIQIFLELSSFVYQFY